MKLLTRDTDYAVRAIIYMAQDSDQATSVAELVDNLSIPRAFSRRILQILSQAGILRSAKGKGGGFVINRPLKKITLCDIVEAFQGKFSAVRCRLKKDICPNIRTCPLRGRMKRIETMMIREMRAITIGELTGSSRPHALRGSGPALGRPRRGIK